MEQKKNNHLPKVTVLVPAYNAEKYLTDCLVSVRHQSKKADEILVVNDGSIDSTEQIAQKYADSCMNRVVNRGIGWTRKDCAVFASSEHIAFLSADDTYHPYFLELMMRHADDKSILFSDYWRCNENLKPQNVVMAPHFRSQHEFCKLVLDYALRQDMFVNFSTIIIPKYVFETVQFDPNLRYGEDLIFLLETVLANIPWKHVALPLVYYRVHSQAGTVQGWNPHYRHLLWQRLTPLLIQLGVEKEAVTHAINYAFRISKRRQRKRRIPKPIIQVYWKIREMTI